MPSVCIQEQQVISPFTLFLAAVSNQLHAEDVRKIRTQLYGHVNKECLDGVQDGRSLLGVLQTRGLLNNKKLSFFRKLLLDSKLLSLVELLDDFKKEDVDSANTTNGKGADPSSQAAGQRKRTLQHVMERQQSEIVNCLEVRKVLRKKLEDAEALLESQKQAIVVGEDTKDSLVEEKQITDAEREHLEERAQECRMIIATEEKELKDMLSQLKSGKSGRAKPSGFSVSPRRERRSSSIDVEEKTKKSSSLKKQSEEKQATLSQVKENERDFRRTVAVKKQSVKSLNAEILQKTEELIEIDQLLLETMETIKRTKRALRQNDFDLFDIQRELEETEEEIKHMKKGNHNKLSKPIVPLFKLKENITQNTTKKLSSSKMLDYNNASEEGSYSFGSLGSKTCPIQFNFPCCIAVGRRGDIYVADHTNRRIHILDEMGDPVREALDLGNTFPIAMAVNKQGNIFVTDSQILKVFSSDGALSHNFLPVYGRKDRRPEISALAVDKEGNVLLADQTNHRIQKFRMDGHFVGFIGGPQYLDSPSGVAVTKKGDVIVSELNACQLKLFNNLVTTSLDVIGRPGIGKGCFGNPRGLALDNGGNILVADTANHRIQVLTLKGEYIDSLGRLGSSPGCLDSPYAVAVNRVGHVIVADTGNHRVTIFT